MWMLDTNICSYVIRERPQAVKRRFDRVGHGNLAVSAIVMAELYDGAARHPGREEAIRRDIESFRSRLQVLPWTESAAQAYGPLRAALAAAGTSIGAMDMLIAAHALAEGAVLVSINLREFERVPGLKLENWRAD